MVNVDEAVLVVEDPPSQDVAFPLEVARRRFPADLRGCRQRSIPNGRRMPPSRVDHLGIARSVWLGIVVQLGTVVAMTILHGDR